MGIRHKQQRFVMPPNGLENSLEIQINDIIVEIVPSHSPKKLPTLLLRQAHSEGRLLIPLPDVEHLLMALIQAMQRSIRIHTAVEIVAGTNQDQSAEHAPGQGVRAGTLG